MFKQGVEAIVKRACEQCTMQAIVRMAEEISDFATTSGYFLLCEMDNDDLFQAWNLKEGQRRELFKQLEEDSIEDEVDGGGEGSGADDAEGTEETGDDNGQELSNLLAGMQDTLNNRGRGTEMQRTQGSSQCDAS